ncbi:MAG: tRNA uridine-5-carboxymethylaminomethyl(34) synthesis GTPase MnmE [Acidobacteriota bacterium]|nr:tRNA uridine-5-carboxymethylaminomethyl(34) synthesis GTPase MnmE [Acidobacteriota bacterium]
MARSPDSMTDATIVAISTPPGRGGLGVVRLSGGQAIEIATRLIKLPKLPLETQHATRGDFVEAESGRVLDQVVVTCFRAPHSYTAEDVVEISCHGAPIILRNLEERCLAEGARPAEPGEFTMRAFLNGRIDLTQAEAVRDLIESQTIYQARVAAQQLNGSVSARLKPHKQVLLELIARLEAGIDFAEDDVSVIDWQEIVSRIDRIRGDLETVAAGYEYGRIVREGLTLAIVGRPNVGKSSLFNRLLNEERAIVTAIPGTTRDLVAETANLCGIPLRFVDTAGVREAQDEVEKIGVERTFSAIADSDLRLMVVDASEPWTEEDTALLEKLRPLGSLLIALNKSDLPPRVTDVAPGLSLAHADLKVGATMLVRTSALTGEGIHDLKEKILALAVPARDVLPEGEFITNLRHQQLVKNSLAGLAKAHQAAEQHTPHEMLLLDLYDALRPLDLITGATYADDVLDIIFKTFCVGK